MILLSFLKNYYCLKMFLLPFQLHAMSNNKWNNTLPWEAKWAFNLSSSLYLFLQRGQRYPLLSSMPRKRVPCRVASLIVFSMSGFCWLTSNTFSLRIACRAICRLRSCALENARPYRVHVGKGHPFVLSFLGVDEKKNIFKFLNSKYYLSYIVINNYSWI